MPANHSQSSPTLFPWTWLGAYFATVAGLIRAQTLCRVAYGLDGDAVSAMTATVAAMAATAAPAISAIR